MYVYVRVPHVPDAGDGYRRMPVCLGPKLQAVVSYHEVLGGVPLEELSSLKYLMLVFDRSHFSLSIFLGSLCQRKQFEAETIGRKRLRRRPSWLCFPVCILEFEA